MVVMDRLARNDDSAITMLQAAMIAWGQVGVFPPHERGSISSMGGISSILQQEADTLKKLAPITSTFYSLQQLEMGSRFAASAAGSGDRQGSNGSYSTAGSAGTSSPRTRSNQSNKPVTLTYQQLLSLRAKELKGMLSERGIDSSDCFEKEELARRLLNSAHQHV